MTGTLYEKLYTFVLISCLVLRRREIFQPKVVEKMKTQVKCTFLPKIVPIMWKNVVEPDRPQMTV